MILLYRSFISDIYRQLQYHQYKDPVRVYRSQLMSIDELEDLEKYIGQFISMNSFLSTSNKRPVALFYMGDKTQELIWNEYYLKSMLILKWSLQNHLLTSVHIVILLMNQKYSSCLVLFFVLIASLAMTDQVWIIQMTLCSDDEHDLKQVLTDMKKQNGIGETNLRTLGKLLWKMGKLDLAEKYYSRFLNEVLPHDVMLNALYEDLADITSQKGDYNMSIQWQQKLLAIKEQTTTTSSINNEETIKTIGKLHAIRSISTYQSINIARSFFSDYDFSTILFSTFYEM